MTNKPNDVRVSRELLPCPFCGGGARFETIEAGLCSPQCCECGVELMNGAEGVGWYATEQEAAADWNRRAQPADQQGEQMARMPVERCYDVRAKMIIAFNEAKKAGGDLDDHLDAAYKSALRFSPNPDAQPATAKVDQRLTEATAFVQKLCDAASGQPSVATGYLSDILDVLQGRSKLNTPQ